MPTVPIQRVIVRIPVVAALVDILQAEVVLGECQDAAEVVLIYLGRVWAVRRSARAGNVAGVVRARLRSRELRDDQQRNAEAVGVAAAPLVGCRRRAAPYRIHRGAIVHTRQHFVGLDVIVEAAPVVQVTKMAVGCTTLPPAPLVPQ